MFKITKQAAEQIFKAAQQGNMEGLALRIAVRPNPDGSLNYLMGFDNIKENDQKLISENVNIVFDNEYEEWLDQATMDFVEFEPGDFRFIFLNPKDANYSPPTEK